MSSTPAGIQSVNPILSLQVVDHRQLRAMVMPFVEQGGLFLPCDTAGCSLGDSFFAFLHLPGVSERLAVHGKVVWISPHSPHGQRRMGLGIQFPASGCAAQQVIDDILASVHSGGDEPPGFTL